MINTHIAFLDKLNSILDLYCQHNDMHNYSSIGICSVKLNNSDLDVTYICADDMGNCCICQDYVPLRYFSISKCEIEFDLIRR